MIGSNENTVKEFIQILEDSFLLHDMKHFSYSLKNQIKEKKKIYCIDNGLIHTVSLNFSKNQGKLLENLVYNELCKTEYKEIYFSMNKKNVILLLK